MTVMLFQLEGSDETLQEGFRTINNAIDKLANPVVRVMPASAAKALGSKNREVADTNVLDAEYVDATEETDEVENAPTEKAKSKGGGSSTPRQPKIFEIGSEGWGAPIAGVSRPEEADNGQP